MLDFLGGYELKYSKIIRVTIISIVLLIGILFALHFHNLCLRTNNTIYISHKTQEGYTFSKFKKVYIQVFTDVGVNDNQFDIYEGNTIILMGTDEFKLYSNKVLLNNIYLFNPSEVFISTSKYNEKNNIKLLFKRIEKIINYRENGGFQKLVQYYIFSIFLIIGLINLIITRRLINFENESSKHYKRWYFNLTAFILLFSGIPFLLAFITRVIFENFPFFLHRT